MMVHRCVKLPLKVADIHKQFYFSRAKCGVLVARKYTQDLRPGQTNSQINNMKLPSY